MPYGFRHLVSQDGQTWYVPRKFLRDALELEIDKVVGNTVLEDHYHLWYLAKSYSDCYGNPDELPFGKQHSDEYARRAIWYFERCLETTKAWDKNKVALRQDEMCYIACILMARAHGFMGDHQKAMEHFNLAEQFSPGRNEHYMYLCYYLEEKNMFEEILRSFFTAVRNSLHSFLIKSVNGNNSKDLSNMDSNVGQSSPFRR
jgi:tetratricopeptide (TPR) repeat protein